MSNSEKKFHVALLSAPWAIFNRPSIQLGALQAYIKKVLPSVIVETYFPYLDVAEVLGISEYKTISQAVWAAEALYSPLVFPGKYQDASVLFLSQLKNEHCSDFEGLVRKIENVHSAWLEKNDFSSWDMVGFSVCFSQLLPSLYLASRLKEKYPQLHIVFGGSTCTPSLAQSLPLEFPFIDNVITGEGEIPLAQLIKSVCKGERVKRSEHEGQIQNISSLPTPDYDDYFKAVSKLTFSFFPRLPIEFSRGCWWNKCTFCNLNLQWKGYRSKLPEKVFAEINELSVKYGILDYTFTDNALPPIDARALFDELNKDSRSFEFFGEIRPLRKQEDYNDFCRGGLTTVQVGIEALSTSLLTRMDKGSTVMENILAMRSAFEAGMQLEGNLILEFPGSTEQEVDDTLDVLDYIYIYPPLSSASFFLGYGSPVYQKCKEFNIKSIAVHTHNHKLFPTSVLKNMPMLIAGYRGDRGVQKKRWRPVKKKIEKWKKFYEKPRIIEPLTYREGGGFILIRQELMTGEICHHRLKGTSRAIYLSCRQPVSMRQLLVSFPKLKTRQLEAFLDDLCRKKLLLIHEQQILALAVKK